MSIAKFKELVHFIVHSCQNDPKSLGAIRLNKTLWFTDVRAYKLNGVSMTGEAYMCRKKGPVPARILATLKQLKKEGKIEIVEPKDKFYSREYISLTPPKTNHLTDDEKEMAKEILDDVLGYTANNISEMSHDIIWEAAAEGEEIPLYATLASKKGEITDEVRAWAEKTISEMSAKAVSA